MNSFPKTGVNPVTSAHQRLTRTIVQLLVHPYTSVATYVYTYFVTFCHITYLFLSHWINGGKCFSTDRVYIFIIDKQLLRKERTRQCQGHAIISTKLILVNKTMFCLTSSIYNPHYRSLIEVVILICFSMYFLYIED